jgi:hypothetical protein
MKRLLAENDIRAAGAAAVADFPPLTDHQVADLARILTPLADDPRWVRLDATDRSAPVELHDVRRAA